MVVVVVGPKGFLVMGHGGWWSVAPTGGLNIELGSCVIGR